MSDDDLFKQEHEEYQAESESNRYVQSVSQKYHSAMDYIMNRRETEYLTISHEAEKLRKYYANSAVFLEKLSKYDDWEGKLLDVIEVAHKTNREMEKFGLNIHHPKIDDTDENEFYTCRNMISRHAINFEFLAKHADRFKQEAKFLHDRFERNPNLRDESILERIGRHADSPITKTMFKHLKESVERQIGEEDRSLIVDARFAKDTLISRAMNASRNNDKGLFRGM